MGLCNTCILFLSFILAPLLLLATPSLAENVENESEFSYVEGSKTGPDHWGDIRSDWTACGNGRMQSPVDLADNKAKLLQKPEPLNRSYRPAKAVMKNRGHDITLKWEEDAGWISINGTKYELKQLHWHWPSEHSINGWRYSLEMHMVHAKADGKLAVVSILYKIGNPSPFLQKMEEHIRKVKHMEKGEVKVGVVDPGKIRNGSSKYYRYTGSLTTPPCTEGIIWTIFHEVRTVSTKQVRLLSEAVDDDIVTNARPVQQLNDRTIGLYEPHCRQH